MTCPRCNGGTLQESVREGITIDACPTCRGLWLDRGELERLVARAADEWEEAMRPPPAYPYRETTAIGTAPIARAGATTITIAAIRRVASGGSRS
jgi:Zn-finger nucleic acid-binding protein